MSDLEKLNHLAKEVKQCRNSQRNYFKISGEYRKGRAASDEVTKALLIAKDHESRVDILVERVMSRQAEIPTLF